MLILSFEHYKQLKADIEHQLEPLERYLSSHPKNEMCMVIEAIRLSDVYQSKKKQFRSKFNELRSLNAYANKHFKKELQKEHANRYKKQK